MYTPKVFTRYELGYVLSRDDLGSSQTYAQMTVQVVPIAYDPYPFRQGRPLVSFTFQANKHKPNDGWQATRVTVEANQGLDPELELLDVGSKIGRFLIMKFGFGDMYHLEDFDRYWAGKPGGQGGLWQLRLRTLVNTAFGEWLGIPRVIDDPRVSEYVKVDEIPPPTYDGWIDNNRAYGPGDGKGGYREYGTVSTQVYAKGAMEAKALLEDYMMNSNEDRWMKWVMAGRPVVSLSQRRGDSSYYIPDPLETWDMLQVCPDLMSFNSYIHPRVATHENTPHYSRIRPV